MTWGHDGSGGDCSSVAAGLEDVCSITACVGAFAALTISSIPWDGPLGAIRIGRINEKLKMIKYSEKNGGERGIRTPETLTRLPVFKTGAFNHSATSPDAKFSRVVNYSYSAYLQDG